MNFKAELYPVGCEITNYERGYARKSVVTHESQTKALERITKVLNKYRIPFDIEKGQGGMLLITQNGEPMKRTVAKRKPKAEPVKPQQPDIVCTQHESGRWEWHYTKTGRRFMASFPYDAEREAQMRKEIAKGIERSLKAPQYWHDSYNPNNRGM